MTDEADQLVNDLAAGGALHAARQLGNDLAGLLWHRQHEATDPDEIAEWREERAAVKARQRDLLAGAPDVDDALRDWGERIRELRA